MARVKIQKITEHLDYDMKRALEDAISEVLPQAKNCGRSSPPRTRLITTSAASCRLSASVVFAPLRV